MCFLYSLCIKLTVRNESSNEARSSSYDIRSGEWETPANTFNGEEDKEGGRKFHQARNEKVNVDVSSCYPQAHDEALINHSTGEPVHNKHRGSASTACRQKKTCVISGKSHQLNMRMKVCFLMFGVLIRSSKEAEVDSPSPSVSDWEIKTWKCEIKAGLKSVIK